MQAMRRRARRAAWLLGSAAGFFLVSARSIRAADGGPELDEAATRNSPLLLLQPEARRLPAPDWVKPGVRISYFVRSATVPESDYGLTESGDGEWEDPQTGKRYKREESVGAGGEGFGQVDVIAVGRTAVALQGSLYCLLQPGPPPTLYKFASDGFLGAAAGPADYWVHPHLLAAAMQTHTPTFFVLKGEYPVNGRPVPSLCVVTREADFYSSQAFSLETGLLVASTVSSRGKLAAVRLPGEDAPRGNKSITTVRLINVRTLTLPGLNGRNPDWAMNVRRLSYAGLATIQIPGAPPMQCPAQMVVEFGKRGPSWACYRSQLAYTIAGTPQSSASEGVCGPAGGFWVDPAAYRDARPGAVLDDDPVTHCQTRIGQVGNGGFSVVLQGPGVGQESVYDAATGRLVGVTVVQPSSFTTFSFRLQGME